MEVDGFNRKTVYVVCLFCMYLVCIAGFKLPRYTEQFIIAITNRASLYLSKTWVLNTRQRATSTLVLRYSANIHSAFRGRKV